jgi:hypothetical protein
MTRCLIPVALLVAATVAHAGLVLEQEVEQSGGPMPGKTKMTISISGDETRVDVGDQFSSIANVKTGEVVSLIHPQKIAMQLPKGAMEEIRKKTAQTVTKPNLKPTGRTDTISGYRCEEYTGTLSGLELTYWVTKDVPDYKSIREQISKVSGSADPFKGALGNGGDLPGLPVRTVVKSPTMGSSTMTLLSIKNKDLPAGEFSVPKDYKTMAVPGGVLPGGGAGGH